MKSYRIHNRPRHHISEKQDRWYWREWGKAKRALQAAGFASHEAEDRRHEIHMEELGADKSHKDFNDQEFECVVAGFLTVSEPDNLEAQIRLRSGSVRRLMEGIRRLAQGREAYIQSILEDTGDSREWVRLDAADLVKLRSTLARRIERKRVEQKETKGAKESEQGGAQRSRRTDHCHFD